MKKLIAVLFLIIFLLTANSVLAISENKYGRAQTPPFPQPAEKDLQKIVFIRYAPGKEPICDKDGVCEKGENPVKCPSDCKKSNEEPNPTRNSACYAFLSGAKPKWNSPEDYYASDDDLIDAADWATDIWNKATSTIIFGAGLLDSHTWGVYDGYNALSYDDYSDPNVIAVTAIWFRSKTIYEYDIMFDTNYFSGKIDLDTVALHEFGHAAGLDDLYDSQCQDEVMYGYYGVKDVLGEGDRIGIQTLYGI